MPVKLIRRKKETIIVITGLSLVELGYIPHFKNVGFYCDDPKLSFKYAGETVSSILLLCVSIFLPSVTVFFTEWLMFRLGRYPRISPQKHPWLGVANRWYVRYILGFFFLFFIIDTIKLIIGEPRPHFLDTCRPLEASNCTTGAYIPVYTCTNTINSLALKDSAMSFPSGHAAFAVYTGVYLTWYLQKRFIVPSYTLTLALQSLMMFWAIFTSASRVVDRRHHWWDVLAGSAFGSAVAIYNLYLLHCADKEQASKKFDNDENGVLDQGYAKRSFARTNMISDSLIHNKNKLTIN